MDKQTKAAQLVVRLQTIASELNLLKGDFDNTAYDYMEGAADRAEEAWQAIRLALKSDADYERDASGGVPGEGEV